MGRRRHRSWFATMPPRTVHVADRPRRCESCNAPTVHTIDDQVIDDRAHMRGEPHRCAR